MTSGLGSSPQKFQVDLAGMVDLLARNMYSGTDVYIRELLQNGFDAITARKTASGTEGEQRIRFQIAGDTMMISDTGIGLTHEQTAQLLATIGASSKRDDFGFARGDFLGRFGIGLLSCFMVSNEIVVYSHTAAKPAEIAIWRGYANGTWEATSCSHADLPQQVAAELPNPCGTTIVLTQNPGESYFLPARIHHLVHRFGAYLPVDIEVTDQPTKLALTALDAPWQASVDWSMAWCEQEFGFTPFAAIKFNVPATSTTGVAFVVPQGTSPGANLRHHVYVHGMLCSTNLQDLVPNWAYFVRVVLNTEGLTPTASREDLIRDDDFYTVQEFIGEAVKAWLVELKDNEPDLFSEFMSHNLVALKSVLATQPDLREAILPAIPFETSKGFQTLDEVARSGQIRYTATSGDFRALATVAAANDLTVVNCGYAFDQEIIQALARDRPELDIACVTPADVLGVLEELTPAEAVDYFSLQLVAEQALGEAEVELVVRRFYPETVPALLLPDAEQATAALEQQAQQLDHLPAAWDGLLAQLNADPTGRPEARKPQLVVNANAAVIRQLAACPNDELIVTALRAYYVQQLLQQGTALSGPAVQWSATMFDELIRASLE